MNSYKANDDLNNCALFEIVWQLPWWYPYLVMENHMNGC